MRKILCMLFAVLLMASCNNEGSMISMPKDEMVAVSTVKVVDGNILPVSREDNATADIALAFASQKCLDEFIYKIPPKDVIFDKYMIISFLFS